MDIEDVEQMPGPSEEVHPPDPENGEEEEEEATLRASTKSVEMECDSSSRKSASVSV